MKDFDQFYVDQVPRLRKYFANKGVQDVDDLIQDTFVKFHRYYSDEIKITPEQYLFGLAKSRLADYYASRRMVNYEFEDSEEDDRLQAEEELEHEARLHEAIQFLPPESRELLELRFEKGLSVKECAEYLGCSERAVFDRLQRSISDARRHFHLGHESPRQPLFDRAYELLDSAEAGDFLETLEKITPLSSAGSGPQ